MTDTAPRVTDTTAAFWQFSCDHLAEIVLLVVECARERLKAGVEGESLWAINAKLSLQECAYLLAAVHDDRRRNEGTGEPLIEWKEHFPVEFDRVHVEICYSIAGDAKDTLDEDEDDERLRLKVLRNRRRLCTCLGRLEAGLAPSVPGVPPSITLNQTQMNVTVNQTDVSPVQAVTAQPPKEPVRAGRVSPLI